MKFNKYHTINFQLLILHAQLVIVLSLPLRSLPILNGIHRAMVITAHAHGAVPVPLGATCLQSDVLQRASFNAFAAADAFVGGAVLAVVSSELVETLVDDNALRPGKTAHLDFGEAFPVAKPWYVPGHHSVGSFNFFPGVLLGVELEPGHADIGLGHDQVEASRQGPAFFFNGFAENLLGKAALIAASASKIHIFRL